MSSSGSAASAIETPPRRTAPRRAAREAIQQMVAVNRQQTEQQNINWITQRLSGNQELIEAVMAMIRTDPTGEERLYRGYKCLGDIPYKFQVLAIAAVLRVEKSLVVNIQDARSKMTSIFLWGSGKTKSWKLPAREMRVSVFLEWYCALHEAAGRVLAGIMIRAVPPPKNHNKIQKIKVNIKINRKNG